MKDEEINELIEDFLKRYTNGEPNTYPEKTGTLKALLSSLLVKRVTAEWVIEFLKDYKND